MMFGVELPEMIVLSLFLFWQARLYLQQYQDRSRLAALSHRDAPVTPHSPFHRGPASRHGILDPFSIWDRFEHSTRAI
jgi:hypothetical protein